MHSLASAARLLERCDSVANAAPLARELGFDADLISLSASHLLRLGLDEALRAPSLAPGEGALRLLLFETSHTGKTREEMDTVLRGLTRNEGLLWLVLAVDRTGETAIGIASGSGRRARTAALVVHRAAVVDSDSETICALAAARGHSDVLTHCRWQEILGRESVGRRFFRTLEAKVRQLAGSLSPPGNARDSSDLALLYVSRLLFLSFLETKGWLNRDHGFLENQYASCMVTGGRFHDRVLAPLFFGTLNTAAPKRASRAQSFGRVPFLNGGLFARAPLERRSSRQRFPDEALGDLFGDLLSRYRFTAREDTARWSEAAIDPEMLGRAFEGLMASRERKRSGAFYTPQSLVSDVTGLVLTNALRASPFSEADAERLLNGEVVDPDFRKEVLRVTDPLRVIDPACGSGAFLVHALEVLSLVRQRAGDPAPLHRIRRRLLTSSIFGVDINPTAVWLCELRLWLSMAIEDPENDPMRVTPLPNLDRNIRVGDSLSGADFTVSWISADPQRVSRLRQRYSRATGPRKSSLARELDRTERRHAVESASARLLSLRHQRREMLAAARSSDLFGLRHPPATAARLRLAELRDEIRAAEREARRLRSGGALPFSFVSGFADVAAAGGFDAVIGNPPWVRTHNLGRESKPAMRRAFRVYRNAAWRAGSSASAAGRGFASQVDLAALFVERSVRLLRAGGILGLVVPSKLWRSLAGGGVRELLLDDTRLIELRDLTEASSAFDAAVYPSIIVAERRGGGQRDKISVLVHRDGQTEQCPVRRECLAFDSSAGSPWLLVPRSVRRAFDRLGAAGMPLGTTSIGRPLLGVKTGCNEAFLVEQPIVEPEILRDAIRGEDIIPWHIRKTALRILWTHGRDGRPLLQLPPCALAHLRRWRTRLESRTDARGNRHWWRLFRTESAACDAPRVVWADIGRRPAAITLEAGNPSVPLNSCYVLRCPTLADADAVTVLLNSSIARSWLDVIAEPARGGYRRYMGWTVALLPLPREWDRARTLLAPVGRVAAQAGPPEQHSLDEAVLAAYGLRERDVSALLQWSGVNSGR